MSRKLERIAALIVVISMLLSLGVAVAAEPPATQAGAVLLINADNGDVLYGKNEEQRLNSVL